MIERELPVDIPDLKSEGRMTVRVQVPPPAPILGPLLGTSCMIRLMVVRTRIEPVKMATPAGLEPKIPLQNTVYTDQITDQYEPY